MVENDVLEKLNKYSVGMKLRALTGIFRTHSLR